MTDDTPDEDAREPDSTEAGWRIKPLTGDSAAAVPVTAEGLSLGRAESNDIVLPSVDFPGVSGTHARVVVRDDVVHVEDLGSKNGTYVAGASITRIALDHGDVFELGHGGPRFVVLSPTMTDQTVVVTKQIVPRRSMGADTVEMVREKLGIPANTKVTDVVKGENRRNTVLLVGVVLLLIAGGIYGLTALHQAEEDVQKLQKQLDEKLVEARGQIDSHRHEWQRRIEKMESVYDSTRKEQRLALEKERDRLRAEIKSRVSTVEVDALKKQLAAANKRIENYDPVKVEQARLATVNKIGRAVVLIEVTQTFVEPKTKKKLYLDDVSGRGMVPNLNGKGRLYSQESTGSGFCFSPAGWILTNAHVVLKKDAKSELRLTAGVTLQSTIELAVVFSNTDRRIQAELRGYVASGNEDLALLKIDPFPGMPTTEMIDTTRPEPPLGKTVYVLGFPLGRRALQTGQTVIASAFRGIVSRSVDNFLQVDAAVHPGNSGGPVIDERGRIIGVVVGMQRVSEGVSSSAMGYIIPIRRAAAVWPVKPKKN